MAVTPELAGQIEQELSGLQKSDIKRPGTSMNKFIDDFTTTLAQVEIDLEALVKAGFDASTLPRSRALLELLSLAYGERRGVTPEAAEKREYFDQQMTLATMDKKRLSVVCSHIAKNCGDKKTQQNYHAITLGSGIIDTLNDNLAMVAMIHENLQIASQVKPGGFTIDETYCNEVKERAVELLMLKGVVVNHGNPQNNIVDRQNRLLSLCMNVMSEIKRFAHAAFFDNLEYYSSNYSTYHSQSGSENDTEEKDTKTTAAS